ncbi:MAG: hypothetical protein JO103_07665, partial [Candidatus Eremiobacteraeota bacterium]|nr:hypothetical protein [Candidatus Eremiobacteraeota bacterium]
MLLYIIWLLPLLGAVLLWAFGPQLKSWAGPVGSALIGVAFAMTLALWNQATPAGGRRRTPKRQGRGERNADQRRADRPRPRLELRSESEREDRSKQR